MFTALLMTQYGLKDWQFEWSNERRILGRCFYKRKVIRLSRPYVELNDESEVVDTILHEIAHAIAGYEADHGPIWQAVAKGLGARPEACADMSTHVSTAQYTAECSCGISHRPFFAKPRLQRSCRSCRDLLVYKKK